MDATTFLDNRGGVSPLDLTGLSPEEIRGVSASRIGREQMMGRMINLLADQPGRDASRRLTEARTRKLEAPTEMTTIKDAEGNEYQIPAEDIVSGLNYLDQAKRNRELNLLTQEQVRSIEAKVPITVEGQEYEVSPAHYASISKATEERKQEDARIEALERYRGKSLTDLSDMDIADFATLGGTGGIAALANRIALAGDTIGLSDAHYRHYANLHVTLTENALEMRSPDDAFIGTINDLAKKLHTSHMMLKVPVTGLTVGRLWGETKAVTVPLPPNVTADMVYAEAEKQGRSVSEILQDIYNATREQR